MDGRNTKPTTSNPKYANVKPQVNTRSNAVDSKQQLAEEILAWAKREFSLEKKPNILPPLEELKKLCRGNMIPVWNYLIENVKNEATVSQMKEALRRHGEIDAEQQEYQKLVQEKSELQALLQDLDNTIDKTHNQVKQTTESIHRRERTVHDLTETLTATEARITLLESLDAEMKVKIRLIQEYDQRLRRLIDKMQSRQLSSTDLVSTGQQNDKPSVLETPSARAIRQIYEELSANLLSYFVENNDRMDLSTDVDLTVPEEILEKARNRILALNLPSAEYISILTSLTRHNMNEMAESARRSDPLEESQKILTSLATEFTGKSNHTEDDINHLFNMHLLLHELREKNFEIYISAESNWAEVAQLQQELENLKFEKLSQIPDLHKRSLVEMSLLLEAEQEVQALLEQEMNKLAIHKKNNLVAEDQMKSKEHRIQKFRNLLNFQAEMIAKLIRESVSERQNFLDTMGKLQSLSRQITNTMQDIETEKNGIKQIQGYENEINAFGKISLSSFLFSDKQGVPVSHLWIDGFNHDASMEKILTQCEFSSAKSYDAFVRHLLDIESQVTSLSWQLQLNQQLKKQVESQIPKDLQDPSSLAKISEEAQQKSLKASQHWSDNMNNTLSSVSEAMKEAELVQQLADDWWNQPAQFTAPWVKVDNKNLQQYIDQLNAAFQDIKQSKNT